ncbi:MAG: DUF1579 family protein [Bacteroidota bacterium]
MKQLLAIALLTCLSFSLPAQEATRNSRPCTGENFHEFDFWLGDWEVWSKDSTGTMQIVGYNKVERILGECVIMENWTGVGDSRGKSFSLYNRESEQWEQTWVDNYGTVIYYGGEYNPSTRRLTFKGEGETQNRKYAYYRLSYFNNEDGTVRQLWEASQRPNGAKSVLFDAVYKRREAPEN